jgi:hypothetical protein
MAKSLDSILGGYTPKAKGEQEFVAKHEIKVTPDANKNGDDVFKASKVKTVKRSPERHGYDKPADEKVNEEKMTSADKAKEKAIKAKTDKSGMKASMQKQYGAEKGKQVYFATIRKQAMESTRSAFWHSEMDKQSKKAHADASEKSKKSAPITSKTLADINSKLGNKKVSESSEVFEGLKYAQVEPKDVKTVLAAHRATGESARHMGGGKIAYSGKKLVTGTQNEAVELEEGVAQDAYNTHHKRAMKAVEDLAKHLMKHKANCDKSNSKWAHSDNLWQMKNMSTQLEDMVHNIASQNENTAEREKNMIDRG